MHMKKVCIHACTILISTALFFPVLSLAAERPEIIIADFEDSDYGGWTTTGNAFGSSPAQGTMEHQRPVTGFKGSGMVNSFLGGDTSTGTLISPPFTVKRNYINFLIGGGKHPGETAVELIISGKAVLSRSGPDDEKLRWSFWDVKKFAGQKAVIKIIDNSTEGWGHINADHFVMSDRKYVLSDLTKEMSVTARYLNIPVKTGAEKRRMKLAIDGKLYDEFDIELAESTPDFWAFVDLGAFRGKTASIITNQPWESDPGILNRLYFSEEIAGTDSLYSERLRPQFHFSPRRGWTNDPNGLVYHNGEYHLYFQHNPYGWNWGNMHWGHAVSDDLVHWEELPVAINPYQYGDWAYSGSAAVDTKNSADFGKDALIAAFTSTGRGECIVWSSDNGRTFTEYEGNPVVTHVGRDPKIFRHEESGHWVMAVYDVFEDKNHISFHISDDLKNWEYVSSIEGYYECPELFELAVDGDSSNRKWVVYAADGNYSIGTFDGLRFRTESGKHTGNYGNCFYASQTYNNIPESDGRRIQIGWGRISMKGMPFNQMMLFPCELGLKTTGEGIRMTYHPAREIESLYGRCFDFAKVTLQRNENPMAGFTGDCYDIQAKISEKATGPVTFSIRGIDVTFDPIKQELRCQDKTAPVQSQNGEIDIRLLVDRCSIEIFAQDGLVYMPMSAYFENANRSYTIRSENGEEVMLPSLIIHEIKSAWK